MTGLVAPDIAPAPATWREHTVAVATVLGWIALAGLIAASYVGHSASPYGVCYSASGRGVPCAAVERNKLR
jgi:hypothetical protein